MALALADRSDIDVARLPRRAVGSIRRPRRRLGNGRARGAAVHQRHRGNALPRRGRRGSPIWRADVGAHCRPPARVARRRRTADHRADEPVRRRRSLVPRSGCRRRRASRRRGGSLAVDGLEACYAVTRPGPVHLNLPFREPLVGVAGELPDAAIRQFDLTAVGRRRRAWSTCSDRPRGDRRRQRCRRRRRGARRLPTHSGWPVLADPMSGCQMLDVGRRPLRRGAASRRIRRCPSAGCRVAAGHAAGIEGARAVARCVGRCPRCRVAGRIDLRPQPRRRPASCTHRSVSCVRSLPRRRPDTADREWIDDWRRRGSDRSRSVSTPRSPRSRACRNRARRGPITASVPAGGHLVVASSMPVRDVEWFGTPRSDVTVHSNRGANGIDGVIATAIGVAIGSGAPTAVLLGDVAFCHDAVVARRHCSPAATRPHDRRHRQRWGCDLLVSSSGRRRCRPIGSSSCSARPTAPTSSRSPARSVFAPTTPRRRRSWPPRSTSPTPVWFASPPIAGTTSTCMPR